MQTSMILNLAQANGGVITSAMVDGQGVSRGILKHLADTGRLVRRARGVYYLPDVPADPLFDLQAQYARGIYSHITALGLLGLLADGEADCLGEGAHMTFPAGYNTSGARTRGIWAHVAKEGLHELGSLEVVTPQGHRVRSYNAERTLCTLAKVARGAFDPFVAQIFTRYAQTAHGGTEGLRRYATLLRTERSVRPYLRELSARGLG